MNVEYLGKVNNIVTVEKLRELTGIMQGTNTATGDITFLKFKANGIELLVADRCICYGLSWNQLNEKGCIFGTNLNISNIDYKCRSLTGSNGDPNIEDTSEWKKLIIDFVPSKEDSNWGITTICQEDWYNKPTGATNRGLTSLTYLNYTDKSGSSSSVGWRPVLERVENFSILGINEDLGDMQLFSKIKYTVTNLSGGNFNLTEKVDGQVIRTLNNQISGTEFTFNIENFDSLAYGKHTIEIIADDPTTAGNVIVTSKFNKIKSPVQPIPTNSNLKQVMQHNKELEKEISYQKYILVEKLKSKYINVSIEEPLSNIIQRIGSISPITQIGEDVILFNKSSVYVSTSEYSKALEFESFTYGDFKIKSTLSNYGSYGLANAKIQHTSSDGLVKFEKVVANDSGNGSMNFEIDILNVLVGDKIVFNLKGYTTSVGAKLTNTNITCGKVFK